MGIVLKNNIFFSSARIYSENVWSLKKNLIIEPSWHLLIGRGADGRSGALLQLPIQVYGYIAKCG